MDLPIEKFITNYKLKLDSVWEYLDDANIEILANELFDAWKKNKNVFVCGNGGSAANANHLANDLLYGIHPEGNGIKIHSLCSNISVNTCLANDTGYEHIFSKQLSSLGAKEDLLIVMSGSGNSRNIIEALNQAKEMGIRTHGMLGYDGGRCIEIVDNAIHFKIQNMQIAEDMQMIIGHILTERLRDIRKKLK